MAFNGGRKSKPGLVGFILLIYPFTESGRSARCNFISNGADRKDVVALFKGLDCPLGQPEWRICMVVYQHKDMGS